MKPFNPESTIITNLALDKIMPSVSPNAWKILCFAIRKTAGWQDKNTQSGRKESDVISISQFRIGCGIASNDTVKDAIDECLNMGYLLRTKEGQSFRYFINQDYEIPAVTESVIPTVTESVTVTVTESVNTNYKVNNKVNTRDGENKQTPAKKNGEDMNKEEYLASVKNSLEKSLMNHKIGYAQYPERLIPVVERMEKYWHFQAPQHKSGKGQFAFWIASCDEIITGCAEFGVKVIDELYQDWHGYIEANGGIAPHTVSSPKSLVNDILAKAALMRGGNHSSLWRINKQPVKQSMLDV